MTRPKVSVAMITYNHRPYIGQALESVFAQELDCSWEVVVGEDASTDGTRDVVNDFQRRYPEKLRLISSDMNVGMMANLVRTLQACAGDYVALLEGDDYWTSPYKLRKQVAFLDGHLECSICFHNASIIDERGLRPKSCYNKPSQKKLSSIHDLWRRNFMATSAVAFRNGLIDRLPERLIKMRFGDWPLHILNARHGDIGYIDEVMSVYRVHEGGAFQGMTPVQQYTNVLSFYDEFDAGMEYEYHEAIVSAKVGWSYLLASAHLEEGNRKAGRALFLDTLRKNLLNQETWTRQQARIFLSLFMPHFLRWWWTLQRTFRAAYHRMFNPKKAL